MGSLLTNLSASLLQHLEGGTYTVLAPKPVWERRVVAYFNREELGAATHVIVIPATSTQKLLARADSNIRQQHEMTVDVVIQSPADFANNTVTDTVAEFAEQVLERVASHKPWTGTSPCQGALYSTGYDPVVVIEDLLQYRIYTSRIVAYYVVVP